MAKNLLLTDTVTIAGGDTTSGSKAMERNRVPLGLIIPSTFTGATVSFQVSIDDGTTFYPLYYEGTLYSFSVGTSRYHAFNKAAFEGVKLFKIVSASTEGTARVIKIVSGE